MTMSWYADTPSLRFQQLSGDGLLLLWIALWGWVANAVHGAVQLLGAPGRELADAGDGLAAGLGGAAERVGEVPVLGGGLRAPLEGAADAGRALARAGAAQQSAVNDLALLLAFVLFALPVAWALARWLPGRLRWVRESTAARRLAGDVDLLALRAATSQPLHVLAELGPEPVARWRRGEAGAAEALAELELRRLGVRA